MTVNLVVPCYNEEAVLPETARRLSTLLDHLVENGSIANDSGIYTPFMREPENPNRIKRR